MVILDETAKEDDEDGTRNLCFFSGLRPFSTV